ncbi:hypothetical protein [Candidatus Methylacidiphilum fumarolicum]|nr:hypothetical protein [Candidatus Methylacidiphilum fumarolicum]
MDTATTELIAIIVAANPLVIAYQDQRGKKLDRPIERVDFICSPHTEKLSSLNDFDEIKSYISLDQDDDCWTKN